MGLFRSHKAFLQTNAWQNQNLNALRYNTSQAGSVVPWMDGTTRIQVNLIDFGNYMGPGGGGKKGKGVGPLPIGGTHSSGAKGGGGSKGKGGGKKGKKGSQDFSVDVDFGICTGPVTIAPQSMVWSSAGVAFFQSVGLNAYSGADGQAADPVMSGLHPPPPIGYSGTCHITGTPMDLGMSPVIPNLSFEPAGPNAGTAVNAKDANPSKVVTRFLSDPRDGSDFPAAWIDPAIDTLYGDYCLALGLVISPALTAQTEAQEWLSGLAKLTNTAIVWSGNLLKMIPYGDMPLSGNGINWMPDLVPKYSLTDDNFLPWHEHQLGQIEENQEDPIQVTRANPADAVNWLTIEYLDRSNFYNSTVLPVFDQGAIDVYNRRTGDNLNGQCFTTASAAQRAAQTHLQRLQYVRNTYKFQLGWQFALLEPMDIVLLTGRAGDLYLDIQPVRITAIEENENGDLTFEAEEIAVALPTCAPPPALPPPPAPPSMGAVDFPNETFMDGTLSGGGRLSDSPTGTFSVSVTTRGSNLVQGLLRTLGPVNTQPRFAVAINTDGSVGIILAGVNWAKRIAVTSAPGIITVGVKHDIALSWNTQAGALNDAVHLTVDGMAQAIMNFPAIGTTGPGFDVGFSHETGFRAYSFGDPFGILGTFQGCTDHMQFGTGAEPNLLSLRYTLGGALNSNPNQIGISYFGNNYGTGGNLSIAADPLTICPNWPG